MTTIAIALVGVFGFFVIRTYVWQYNAKLNGVDTEATVSWIERMVRTGGGDAAQYPITYYYVRFRRQDGSETEARLLNPSKKLELNSRVRIRYLPWRDELATLMEVLE